MAMQTQLFSLSGLGVELDIDRRTLAKKLDNLPPAATDPDGTKRWRIRDVLEHLKRADESPAGLAGFADDYRQWVCHQLVPALFGAERFIRVFTGGLRAEVGLTKAQTLRAYQVLLIATVSELERALGPGTTIKLPLLGERLARDGIDQVVADLWPDVSRETSPDNPEDNAGA